MYKLWTPRVIHEAAFLFDLCIWCIHIIIGMFIHTWSYKFGWGWPFSHRHILIHFWVSGTSIIPINYKVILIFDGFWSLFSQFQIAACFGIWSRFQSFWLLHEWIKFLFFLIFFFKLIRTALKEVRATVDIDEIWVVIKLPFFLDVRLIMPYVYFLRNYKKFLFVRLKFFVIVKVYRGIIVVLLLHNTQK